MPHNLRKHVQTPARESHQVIRCFRADILSIVRDYRTEKNIQGLCARIALLQRNHPESFNGNSMRERVSSFCY